MYTMPACEFHNTIYMLQYHPEHLTIDSNTFIKRKPKIICISLFPRDVVILRTDIGIYRFFPADICIFHYLWKSYDNWNIYKKLIDQVMRSFELRKQFFEGRMDEASSAFYMAIFIGNCGE